MLNPKHSFQVDSLLATTKLLGEHDTLWIDLTMKQPSGFESASPGLVIDKHLIAMYAMYKIFKIYVVSFSTHYHKICCAVKYITFPKKLSY